MMQHAKQQFACNFFMDIFMLGAWLIWKQRNDVIFNRGITLFQRWKGGFLEEAFLQANRFNPSFQASFISVKFVQITS
jgi:hypothetical protein